MGGGGRLGRLGNGGDSWFILTLLPCESRHLPPCPFLDLISCLSSVHLGEEEEEEKGQATW